MTIRINSWSGPRNISTAVMRSFSQREDTRAVDEPLYGHYLKVTRAPHPGRDELLDILETDFSTIVEQVVLGPCDRPVLFMKQMVHHLTDGVDLSFLERCINVMLIRDPEEVIASLINQLPEPSMTDVGLGRQIELFRDLRARGQEPPVIDARLLLQDPAGVLEQLCERVGIAWDPAMLSWPAGPAPEDGPWAKYWYDSLHTSTGFATYRKKDIRLPERLEGLLNEARSYYSELSEHAIEPRKGR